VLGIGIYWMMLSVGIVMLLGLPLMFISVGLVLSVAALAATLNPL
jgi:hypothetical protein